VPSLLEKWALQACIASAGSVAVVGGGWGVLHGAGVNPEATSHARYLSGLLFAIGVASWTTLPDIARKAGRLRLLVALVVIGGLCRLLGVVLGDLPSWHVVGALVVELAVTPLLCLWQSRWSTGFVGQRLAISGSVTYPSADTRRMLHEPPAAVNAPKGEILCRLNVDSTLRSDKKGPSSRQVRCSDSRTPDTARSNSMAPPSDLSHEARTIRFNPLADFLAAGWRWRRRV
jgi:hypothetical protein